jgi:hypothetical protein
MKFASVTEAGGAKSVDKALLEILKNSFSAGSGVPNSQDDALTGISKINFRDSIGQIQIVQLGSDGDAKNPIETWTLVNPFFTNIKFGDLSYDSEEVVDVECTVRYDSATYTPGTNAEQ